MRTWKRTIRGYNPAADFQHIQAAFAFAREAHKDQKRKSGEPYIIHPLAVGPDRGGGAAAGQRVH